MKKDEEKMNLSYESDGKMGKENRDEVDISKEELDFFTITPSSE
jgi:hypothetical protein